MISDRVHKTLKHKSKTHQAELRRLGKAAEEVPLSRNVIALPLTPQVRGINTLLMDPELSREDFIFNIDRLAVMLLERATELLEFSQCQVQTPTAGTYDGLQVEGTVSAVVMLPGGTVLESGLKRVLPDCNVGRMLIQSSFRTGEPELHFFSLSPQVAEHSAVMLLDAQTSSGGAALMAVRVLLDHGVSESRIIFVTYMAGHHGLRRLMAVFPDIRVVVCRVVEDSEVRWVEQRYLGC